jgi:shikimate 5-dehydrogenase
MYFIGVTTGKSSIMQVFPKWSAILGINSQIVGYDVPIHAPAEAYQRIVTHIKTDPLAMGALVTTHKIDLLHATRDQFDYLDPFAVLCDEVSSISKQAGRLEGHAKDPISSGLALEAFIPRGHWGATDGHVLCLGAGGAAIAISVYLIGRNDPADRPRKFIAVDLNPARLDALKAIVSALKTDIEFVFARSESAAQNDALMAALPPGSLVINATGMGKDRPGSPVTDAGQFPAQGYAWELNYRGELDFFHQARRQVEARGLTVNDGWVYFLHGWSQVVAQVFHLTLTPDLFAALDKAAASIRS